MVAPTSVLKLIQNIKSHGDNDMHNLHVISKSRPSATIRANQMGEALECFMKDAFCNVFSITDGDEKHAKYREKFSFLGNQNNPPDMIIEGSDAIEVKKLDKISATDIHLNSSYPKAKLHSDSSMLTQDCKSCEGEAGWTEKDIVYAIGFVDGHNLRVLALVYGDCYAAKKEVYERIRGKIEEGVESANVELAETVELARVNAVDPLGITYLRVRGMWGIKSPFKVFESIFDYSLGDSLTVFALMKKSKFDSFPSTEKDALAELDGCTVSDKRIKNPDNPAQLMDAKLIKLVI